MCSQRQCFPERIFLFIYDDFENKSYIRRRRTLVLIVYLLTYLLTYLRMVIGLRNTCILCVFLFQSVLVLPNKSATLPIKQRFHHRAVIGDKLSQRAIAVLLQVLGAPPV